MIGIDAEAERLATMVTLTRPYDIHPPGLNARSLYTTVLLELLQFKCVCWWQHLARASFAQFEVVKHNIPHFKKGNDNMGYCGTHQTLTLVASLAFYFALVGSH